MSNSATKGWPAFSMTYKGFGELVHVDAIKIKLTWVGSVFECRQVGVRFGTFLSLPFDSLKRIISIYHSKRSPNILKVRKLSCYRGTNISLAASF
jgi:hypothetical protein